MRLKVRVRARASVGEGGSGVQRLGLGLGLKLGLRLWVRAGSNVGHRDAKRRQDILTHYYWCLPLTAHLARRGEEQVVVCALLGERIVELQSRVVHLISRKYPSSSK